MRIAFATLLALGTGAVSAAPLVDPLDLRGLSPAQGTVILGAQVDDQVGWSLAAAGDWNADGRPDLVVGSPSARRADTGERTGLAHVIFGTDAPPALIPHQSVPGQQLPTKKP